MRKITAALIGAGARGVNAYASYALRNPHEIQFIAVSDPDSERLNRFKQLHDISNDMCFSSWEHLLDKPKLADVILICTQDNMHYEPALKALEKGYHILLEKPMSNNLYECIDLGRKAMDYNKVYLVCHVLRYTDFFSTIKRLLSEERIGRLISIQHNENVAYWHQAHSFVRGKWRNSKESSPMILAKSCHDMDILLYLAEAECTKISSFGFLTHFKKENAPQGAPAMCLDGCPAKKDCLYYAPKIYLTDNTGWPTSVISNDPSFKSRMKALKEGPYGRCVYFCDNDVVDHQVVNIEFANEVTAAFTMCAFTNECSRTIKLMGTKGEIRGSMEKNEIEIIEFATGARVMINLKEPVNGHSGGDYGIMQDLVELIQADGKKSGLTSAGISAQSHVMAFAAETSRLESRVINLKEYISEVPAQIRQE